VVGNGAAGIFDMMKDPGGVVVEIRISSLNDSPLMRFPGMITGVIRCVGYRVVLD